MNFYNWNAEKNEQLIAERGVSFEEIVFYIENGGLLDEIAHPNAQDYAHQRIFVVAVENYVHLVPYVENDGEYFLKTIIPSRKFTKIYLGEEL
ncbi:Ribonuclease toxin, BrnT, of type II toxin-antitoxin system [Nitrosomonas sp. Nm51]|uniref:BrnT family toxin n=1 Tax=Nitrosomonas sp. Nm51 TaxID=133720 RepID=UPI0008D4565A|nr:BrnT family toxin [Nitrosomonas sp. Nm51]SER23194.1 Ribonuclease toxin, BrnT, of type II toxin-antitoxin system [Nitrosomonas sp. Nm51]